MIFLIVIKCFTLNIFLIPMHKPHINIFIIVLSGASVLRFTGLIIRKIEAASGAEKKIHEKEIEIRQWAHRSLVTTRSLEEGDTIDEDSIWTKRPGTGIPAKQFRNIVGRRVNKRLPKNHLLQWNDIEDVVEH